MNNENFFFPEIFFILSERNREISVLPLINYEAFSTLLKPFESQLVHL